MFTFSLDVDDEWYVRGDEKIQSVQEVAHVSALNDSGILHDETIELLYIFLKLLPLLRLLLYIYGHSFSLTLHR